MKINLPLLLAFLLVLSKPFAQPGTLDPTFGSAGFATAPFTSASSCKAMALFPSGKILLGGVYTFAGVTNLAFARFSADGVLDAGFGAAGTASIPLDNSNGSLTAVQITSDGKIIASGSSNSKPMLVRLNTNGQVDASFGTAGFVTFDGGMASVLDIKILSNGKIAGCGSADLGSGKLFCAFQRNADGSADAGFGTAGFSYTDVGTQSSLTRMAIQPDGKIILTGTVYNSGTLYDLVMVRYSSAGVTDNTFGTSGIAKATLGVNTAYEQGERLAFQSDGKIVVAARIANAGPTVFALARFNANGTKDTGFGTNGVATINFNNTLDEPKSVAIQSDGKILICGSSVSGSNRLIALARYNTNGTPDNTFGTSGKATAAVGTTAYGEDMAIQSNGKILVGGYAKVNNLNQFAVSRFISGLVVGTESPENAVSSILVYPNPVQDNRVHVRLDLLKAGEFSAKVLDELGRTVYTTVLGNLPAGPQEIQVELPAGLPTGAYHLLLFGEQGASGVLFVRQ